MSECDILFLNFYHYDDRAKLELIFDKFNKRNWLYTSENYAHKWTVNLGIIRL